MFKKKERIEITIKGMKCNHCKERVLSALENILNVTKVNINLSDGKTIIYYHDTLDKEKIREEIENLGYEMQEEK